MAPRATARLTATVLFPTPSFAGGYGDHLSGAHFDPGTLPPCPRYLNVHVRIRPMRTLDRSPALLHDGTCKFTLRVLDLYGE